MPRIVRRPTGGSKAPAATRASDCSMAACAIIIISAQCFITLMIARRALSGIHTSGRIAFAFAFLHP